MRAALTAIVAFACCTAPTAAAIERNPAADHSWIADDAALLSDAGRTRLRGILQRTFDSTHAAVVFVTVPKASPTPRDHARRLFDLWKPGSAADNNGVLLLVSRDDRAVEILTGSGLSTTLPDRDLQQLLRNQITPLLRDAQYDNALLEAAKELAARLRNFDRRRPAPRLILSIVTLAAGFIGLAGAAMLYRVWKKPRPLPTSGRSPALDRYPPWDFATIEPKGLQFAHAPAASYPAPAILAAAAGLSLFAAALSGLLFPPADLEPAFLTLAAISVLTSVITTLGMHPPSQSSFKHTPKVLAFLTVLGLLWAFAIRGVLASDFTFATWILPGYALFVNGIAALIYRSALRDANPRPQTFVCNQCATPLPSLTRDDIRQSAATEPCEKKAIRENTVEFRGWRCPKCKTSHLVWKARDKASICRKCDLPSIFTREERQQGIDVEIRSCARCKAEERTTLRYAASKSAGPAAAAASSADSSLPDLSSSYSSSSTSSYDDTQFYDSNTSSYDADSTGGSTSGGGASSDW